jgi:hypothetical protein
MNAEDDVEVVSIPISTEDVAPLEDMLAAVDPFVTTTMNNPEPYKLAPYVRHSLRDMPPVVALLDRNLVSRAIQMANGAEIQHDRPDAEMYRIAAACIAFLITADVIVEPNIAFYEIATDDQDLASAQVTEWRVADHIHPQAYLEVALRRAHGIHPDVILDARRMVANAEPVRLDNKLRYFRYHLHALSKVAELERSALSRFEKMRALIDWCADEFVFTGVAMSFAILYFGPNRPARMIKSVRSHDPESCIRGVHNAAWDLTYISTWAKSARESQDKIWMFCTADQTLRRIARAALVPDAKSAEDLFRECWPIKEAAALASHYLAAVDRVDRPERRAHVTDQLERVDATTREIHEAIRRGAVERF